MVMMMVMMLLLLSTTAHLGDGDGVRGLVVLLRSRSSSIADSERRAEGSVLREFAVAIFVVVVAINY